MKHNPVLDVYDLFRTARLNVKYTQAELKKLQSRNFWMEVLLAVSASSTVGGLWLWQGALGGYAWKLVGTFAAFLAILKPILNVTEKIQRKQEMLAGYRTLDYDLHKITVLISQGQKYDGEIQGKFLEALDREGELVKQDKDAIIDTKLVEECYEQVLLELPADKFYLPEE
jgi:hypothetical protein